MQPAYRFGGSSFVFLLQSSVRLLDGSVYDLGGYEPNRRGQPSPTDVSAAQVTTVGAATKRQAYHGTQ